MIVLDSSAAVDLLIENQPRSEWVRERVLDRQLSAPHVIDLEVAGALRNLVVRGALRAQRAETALSALTVLRIERHSHVELLPRIWQLHPNVTPYDAAYVALAEALEKPLVTTDIRLARAPGLRAEVIAYDG